VTDPARASGGPAPPRFEERPTERIVRDGWMLAGVPLALGLVLAMVGAGLLAWLLVALGVFALAFFRNPARVVPGDERSVVAPADGKVLEANEFTRPDGSRGKRVAIFLSVFDVHVNRIPVAGRVVSIERGGTRYLAAFDGRVATENVRVALGLETERGERVEVVQITGLIARRIVCHPRVGEWVERGMRYGLIRFGSRTDVVLPPEADLRVRAGDRVRGGETVVALLPKGA
jgi:phosphatidylserine decarboxylase